MKTKVKFYMESKNEVVAVFPELKYNDTIPYTCYSHVGQHSGCAKEYLKGKVLASPEQYNDLFKELTSIGYELEVIDTRKPISKILYPVNSKYGAPMGRNNIGKKPTNGVLHDNVVQLSEGYDKGGAYWGYPNNLRVEYTSDLSYINFYRK